MGGPRRFTTIVEKDEVRPGGQWRYVQTGTDGNKYAFYGVYREVVPGRKISRTFEFEGMPGHIMTESCAFEEQGGKTKLKVTCAFDTKEERDGMYSSGMEAGASESWDQLAEVLAAMKQGSKHN